VNILFVHGWGGSPELWREVSLLLPGNHTFYDRGYFGTPAHTIRTAGFDAIVLHSMAPLFLHRNEIPAHIPVALINGFDHFCGTTSATGRAVNRTLDRMVQQCELDADATLASFYTLGRCPVPPLPAQKNVPALQADLNLLRNHQDIAGMLNTNPVLAIFSQNDVIAPAFSRNGLERNASKVIFADSASHFLPLTHARWLAETLIAWMNPLHF
jgi:pimeloyl-ACP methyl ester carboxylesterase